MYDTEVLPCRVYSLAVPDVCELSVPDVCELSVPDVCELSVLCQLQSLD